MKKLIPVVVLLSVALSLSADTVVFADSHAVQYEYRAENVSGSIVSVTGQHGSASFRTISERDNANVTWASHTRDVGHDSLRFRVMAFSPEDYGDTAISLITTENGGTSKPVYVADYIRESALARDSDTVTMGISVPSWVQSLKWYDVVIPYSAFSVRDGDSIFGTTILFEKTTRQMWWDEIKLIYNGNGEELTLFIGDVMTTDTSYTYPLIVWGKNGSQFILETSVSLDGDAVWLAFAPITVRSGNHIHLEQVDPKSFTIRFFRAKTHD